MPPHTPLYRQLVPILAFLCFAPTLALSEESSAPAAEAHETGAAAKEGEEGKAKERHEAKEGKESKEGQEGKENKEGKEGKEGHEGKEEQPSDLHLSGFFSEGWDQDFAERPREERAPRFSLFQSRQGFLERVGEVKYTRSNALDSGATDEDEFATGVELGLNRRFEIDAETRQVTQHMMTKDGASGHGLQLDVGARFQLVDTASTGFGFEVRCVTPNETLGRNP